MKLYLDEHIPVALSALLSTHGVDCLTTKAAGNRSLSDEDQLAYATQEGRALVTFDRKDFLLLVSRWQTLGRSHAGLIVSRELPLPELLRRFRSFIIRYRTHDLMNQVFWLQPVKEEPHG